MTVYRFAAGSGFNRSRSIRYQKTNQGFAYGDQAVRELQVKDAWAKETFLDELQEFPLGKMVETGYLTAKEAKMFSNLGSGLQTGQVGFYESSRVLTAEEAKQYPPDLLASRRAAYDYEYDAAGAHATNRVRTATLWSVGGQILDLDKRIIESVKLPWEREEARKGQSLDRTKHKFVWEWGRAAQDIADEVTPLKSASVANMYLELLSYGGKLEDAFVMFHSFDEVNTRHYLNEFPGSTYPKDWTDKSDMLFMVPLAEMLKKHPPSGFSERVAKIVNLSGGKISEIRALSLLMNLKSLRWQELDLGGRFDKKNPVIIHDVSMGWILNLYAAFRYYQLDEPSIERILDYLVPHRPSMHTVSVRGKYEHAADSPLTGHYYQKNNAVEISGLDPELAAEDPSYVVTMLYRAYDLYVMRSAIYFASLFNISPMDAKAMTLRELQARNIKIGITTSSDVINNQLKHLHPVAT
ncbi:MAG: hypothetical protein EOP05_16420, partial [Proteobacteria bacterium]